MAFKSLRPIIWTKDLQKTTKFYKKLGFKIADQNEDWIWACLQKDDVEIMLAYPNEGADFERANFTGSFYFVVDNIDELWNQVKDDCEVVYEIEAFEWDMREFAIYDNNGYILQFGQEIEVTFED
ncbi:MULTISPECIES: VOC family protein [unclassified Empedobacter]|uniref:VOC family protein n=1 Tax=unclassified Empedobacter TaxID=2643773 RepID=UPI0025BB745E|nr:MULTISPECIES: VOC family protein [unclassified Empedobacter]